jgi:hypothetical protein
MVAIQVRDVPDAVREALAAEADARGQSLQVFLSEVLEREARLARNRAWLKRTRDNPISRIAADESSADLIRRQRDERTQQILDPVSGSTA